MDDKTLFEAGYNRVYDSLEPEVNLDHVEEVMDDVLSNWDAEEVACSWKIHRKIGETLHKQGAGRGILKSAYEHNVPVFVPAFSDSELGIDFALQKIARQREKKPLLRFDPFEDFEKFADTMLATKRMGLFTVGGGVPRNWSQQFGVYAELLARRGYKKIPLKRYNYGVRICPEPVHWGGLSGSTSWELLLNLFRVKFRYRGPRFAPWKPMACAFFTERPVRLTGQSFCCCMVFHRRRICSAN
jgi:deoxyhypusine synthase